MKQENINILLSKLVYGKEYWYNYILDELCKCISQEEAVKTIKQASELGYINCCQSRLALTKEGYNIATKENNICKIAQ